MTADNEPGGIALVLGAFADLGSKTDTGFGMLDRTLRGSRPRPVRKVAGGSTISGGAGAQLVVCTVFPAAGRVWNIRKAGVFGADAHTVIAGAVADFYHGQQPDPSISDMQSVFLTGVAVPSVNYPPREAEWAQSGEFVYALVYGTVATNQLAITITVDEYLAADIEAMSI